MLFSQRLGLDLRFPQKIVVFHNIYKLRSKCIVFRCRPLLSAGTASASSRNPLCGVFRHVLGLRTARPTKTYVPAGVNGPSLQTTIVIVKANFILLLPNAMLAKEIHEDSLKKKPAFSACDVPHRSFPCPAGKRRRWDPTASVLCE